jgi:hypothetical protein
MHVETNGASTPFLHASSPFKQMAFDRSKTRQTDFMKASPRQGDGKAPAVVFHFRDERKTIGKSRLRRIVFVLFSPALANWNSSQRDSREVNGFSSNDPFF